MQGRGALTEVLRLRKAADIPTIQEISKKLPQRDKISDKLEEQKEDSIIRWTLNNEPERLEDYVRLEDGNIVGEYADFFKQAIRIEGTIKGTSRHASAVVISSEVISDISPLIKDRSNGKMIAGFEFKELEALGLPKLDILGLSHLDKCMAVQELLMYGEIRTKPNEEVEYNED
jgi:DNA polymerase-3 subunit alpha